MTNCPSCGRYVGPYDACPHCGAALSGRIPVRLLKIAALLLAFGGLALLWLLASNKDVPTVEIGQANSMMNLAYVRVAGLVTRPPTYDPKTDYFSFWLTDDTGELHVAVYRNETRALIEARRTPVLGDRVSIKGTLRIRDDYISLTLNLPQHLEIQRDEPASRPIGDITAADELTRLRVLAQVRAVHTPYPGLTLIGLRDSTGEIDLAIPQVTIDLWGDLPSIAVGQVVEIVAPISLYKGTPQLSLARTTDLNVLYEVSIFAPTLAINRVDAEHIGQWATVRGQVTQVSPFSAGVKYTLDDGSGQLTLLLWQNVYDQLPDPGALSVGATLEAQGEITAYSGEIEIVPELPSDVKLLAISDQVTHPQATSTTTAPPHVAIGALGENRLGETVIISGTIQDATSFSSGFKFALNDGSGQIILLTRLDTYDEITASEGLRPGAFVQVEGQVSQFEDELQIIPAQGAGVIVLKPAQERPPARQIGSLTIADANSWATLAGHVVRTETFQSGLRLYLNDGTGEILVLLWQNVLQRLPEGIDPPSVGSYMRLTGRIEGYEGTLEIVPPLPFDLQIVEPPAASTEPAPTSTPAPVPLGELDTGRLGEHATVSGQVINATSFSRGFKFTLDDGTDQIVLLIWDDVYDECPNAPRLNLGAKVNISGEITQFEDELQIEPRLGQDIRVIVPGDPFTSPQAISAIAEHVGQRVTIVGQVLRAEESEEGVRMFITDGTGEALIFVWDNVFQRIPGHQALATPGAHVRVTGVVQEYRGALEIVPGLPYDLELLE